MPAIAATPAASTATGTSSSSSSPGSSGSRCGQSPSASSATSRSRKGADATSCTARTPASSGPPATGSGDARQGLRTRGEPGLLVPRTVVADPSMPRVFASQALGPVLRSSYVGSVLISERAEPLGGLFFPSSPPRTDADEERHACLGPSINAPAAVTQGAGTTRVG